MASGPERIALVVKTDEGKFPLQALVVRTEAARRTQWPEGVNVRPEGVVEPFPWSEFSDITQRRQPLVVRSAFDVRNIAGMLLRAQAGRLVRLAHSAR